MTDRELLELAAKAAGIDWPQNITGFQAQYEGMRAWNPLTNDGDALRLAVKLEMALDLTIAMQDAADVQANNVHEQCNADPCAATRRAIVRAAASIGENQDEQ